MPPAKWEMGLHCRNPYILVLFDATRKSPDLEDGVRIIEKIGLALAALAVAAAAYAAETITYSYDSRGRLVKVVRSGTVNNNVQAEYVYDKADNRTNVNVISPNPPPK